MMPLDRAALVVKPSLPCIHWIRKLLGAPLSVEETRRQGSVYLISADALDAPVDAIVEHYGSTIFELELESWTTDRALWPADRDAGAFRKWFDVELRDEVVDLDFEPIYFQATEDDYLSELDGDYEESAYDDWEEEPHVEFELPPYDELFPPNPFADGDDSLLLAAPPAKGRTQGLVHQFKIRLVGADPEIWRRIQVASGYSFWDLHVAIADAMGWLDYHLHLFSVRNPETGALDPLGIYDEVEPDCLPEEEYPISGYFREPGDRCWYTYDFGDMWVHEIELEGIFEREKGKRYPVCLDGAGACPPEDVGGIPGYRRMLRILQTPSHPEHASFVEWTGGAFDPEQFDPKRVRFDSPRKRWEIAFLGE